MGLEPIKAIAHRLEALFKAFYSESVVIDGELESQLLRAFDCLRLPLTQQLAEGAFDGDQALALAEPVLQTLEQRLAGAIAETENFRFFRNCRGRPLLLAWSPRPCRPWDDGDADSRGG